MSSNNDYGGGGVLEISRNVSKTHEKSRNLLKTHGILQNPPESMEFHWNLLKIIVIYNEIYRT